MYDGGTPPVQSGVGLKGAVEGTRDVVGSDTGGVLGRGREREGGGGEGGREGEGEGERERGGEGGR